MEELKLENKTQKSSDEQWKPEIKWNLNQLQNEPGGMGRIMVGYLYTQYRFRQNIQRQPGKGKTGQLPMQTNWSKLAGENLGQTHVYTIQVHENIGRTPI